CRRAGAGNATIPYGTDGAGTAGTVGGKLDRTAECRGFGGDIAGAGSNQPGYSGSAGFAVSTGAGQRTGYAEAAPGKHGRDSGNPVGPCRPQAGRTGL